MTAAGVACGICGTALRDSAKFCDACGARTGGAGDCRRVQAGYGAVRRRRPVDGHRGCGGNGAAPRVHGRTCGALGGDGPAATAGRLKIHGGRNHGGLRGAGGVGGPRFSGVPCRLGIQAEAIVWRPGGAGRDGVALQLRVGLNSGQVIAGEIGSESKSYAATGSTWEWPSAWSRWRRRAG